MLFNSFVFGVFFLVVLALERLLTPKGRRWMLLVASNVFYGAWSVAFLGLMWLSATVDFVAARVIDGSSDTSRRRLALCASLGTNLGILGFFKYGNFFLENLDALLRLVGLSVQGLRLDVVLPVGISFYTFQAMSYVIDVYWRRIPAVRSWPDYALYISFFPQLVAGPIERAPHLLPQLQRERSPARRDFHEGMLLIAWGLFLKVVVADNLARIVDPVYSPGSTPSGLQSLLATYAFVIQVYGDFAGYSNIARGTAQMLGVRLMLNFKAPYLAPDMADLWRRWHISLVAWLRDYVYIPLGGNRGSELRSTFNTFLVMLIAGVWHGANWTFVCFGLFHGACVALTRQYRRVRPEGPRRSWLGVVLTFHLWVVGSVFFRGVSLEQCFSFLGSWLTDLRWEPGAWATVGPLLAYSLPVLAFDVLHERSGNELFVLRWPFAARVAFYLAVLYAILIFGRNDAVAFIYFQF